MAQSPENALTIDDVAQEYCESFINGDRKVVCESLACLDTQPDAVAITARMMLGLPSNLQGVFSGLLELRARE